MEHDAGVAIGHTDLVETSDEDEIVYAKRLNRDNFTRFVKNKQAPVTSFFTVVLYRDKDNNYELASTWVGRLCPPFPDDVNATSESSQFWGKHALVFGNQAIQEDTLTKKQPW